MNSIDNMPGPVCHRTRLGSFGAASALAVFAALVSACASPPRDLPQVTSQAASSQASSTASTYDFSTMNYTPYELTLARTSGPGKFTLPPSTVAPASRSGFQMSYTPGPNNYSVIDYRLSLSQWMIQMTATPGGDGNAPRLSCAWVDLDGNPIPPPPAFECGVTPEKNELYLVQGQRIPLSIGNQLVVPLKVFGILPKFDVPPPARIAPTQTVKAVAFRQPPLEFEYVVRDMRVKFAADFTSGRPLLSCQILNRNGTFPIDGPGVPTCATGPFSSPLSFVLLPPTTPSVPITISNHARTKLPLNETYTTYTYNALPEHLVGSTVAEAPAGAALRIDYGFVQIRSKRLDPTQLECEHVPGYRCEIENGPQPRVGIYDVARASRSDSASKIRQRR